MSDIINSRVLKGLFNALLFCFFAAKINGDYFIPMVGAWLCHEFGHVLAGLYLKTGLALKANGLGGFALNLKENCFGYSESFLALSGPGVNFALAAWAYAMGYDLFYEANLVLAFGNLLPVLPFDGGKIIRGVLSRHFSWLVLTKALIYLGQVFALVFAGLIIKFQLNFWLLIIPAVMYLLAVVESKNALGLLHQSLIENGGKAKKIRRVIKAHGNCKVYKVLLKMSPGYDNLVKVRGKSLPEEVLLACWLNNQGQLPIAEI